MDPLGCAPAEPELGDEDVAEVAAAVSRRVVEMYNVLRRVAGCAEGERLEDGVARAMREKEAWEAEVADVDRAGVDAFWAAYDAVGHQVGSIVDVLNNDVLGSVADDDAARAAFLMARAEALALKLEVTRLELLAETYTPRTLPALEVIHGHVLAALRSARAQLEEATRREGAYGVAGAVFGDIAAKYAAILEDIENKKWALEELGHDPRFAFDRS